MTISIPELTNVVFDSQLDQYSRKAYYDICEAFLLKVLSLVFSIRSTLGQRVSICPEYHHLSNKLDIVLEQLHLRCTSVHRDPEPDSRSNSSIIPVRKHLRFVGWRDGRR